MVRCDALGVLAWLAALALGTTGPHASTNIALAAAHASPTQTIQLVEGASLELPADWEVQVEDTGVAFGSPAETVALIAASRDRRVSLQFDARESGRMRFALRRGGAGLATERASLEAKLADRGSIVDLARPSSNGFFLYRRDPFGSDQYFFYIELVGTLWHFRCSQRVDDAPEGAAMRGASPATSQAASPGPAAPAPPAVTAAQPPTSSQAASTPETGPRSDLVAALSRDPRLASLPTEDREWALEEAGQVLDYCEVNVSLGSLYECGCMATELFGARLRVGFERTGPATGSGTEPNLSVTTSSLLQDMSRNEIDTGACVAPSKAASYARSLGYRMLGPSVSEEARDAIADCVGREFAESFQARPRPDITYAQQFLVSAMSTCRQ
jgi:hypothetical protein